jgi:hypothetical protein
MGGHRDRAQYQYLSEFGCLDSRNHSKAILSEPTSIYREGLDITLSCVVSSIEVIGSGSSGLQER